MYAQDSNSKNDIVLFLHTQSTCQQHWNTEKRAYKGYFMWSDMTYANNL